MSKHSDIIKRLEAATGPDDWLSHLVAAETGIYPAESIKSINDEAKVIWFNLGMAQDPCPNYTASIDAALELVERLLPGHEKRVGDDQENGRWWAAICAEIWDENFTEDIIGEALTGPLAILLALFRALEVQEQSHE